MREVDTMMPDFSVGKINTWNGEKGTFAGNIPTSRPMEQIKPMSPVSPFPYQNDYYDGKLPKLKLPPKYTYPINPPQKGKPMEEVGSSNMGDKYKQYQDQLVSKLGDPTLRDGSIILPPPPIDKSKVDQDPLGTDKSYTTTVLDKGKETAKMLYDEAKLLAPDVVSQAKESKMRLDEKPRIIPQIPNSYLAAGVVIAASYVGYRVFLK